MPMLSILCSLSIIIDLLLVILQYLGWVSSLETDSKLFPSYVFQVSFDNTTFFFPDYLIVVVHFDAPIVKKSLQTLKPHNQFQFPSWCISNLIPC